MEANPITEVETKVIALEEGLRAAINLDTMRLAMLNDAVDWIEDITGMDKSEIRREISYQRAGQVKRSLDTIRAVRNLI